MTTAGEASSAIIPGDEGAHSQHDPYKRDPHERLGRLRQRAVVGKLLGEQEQQQYDDGHHQRAMIWVATPIAR
jgi:hypothetical protein